MRLDMLCNNQNFNIYITSSVLVSSVRPFSSLSTTVSLEGPYLKAALINEEPIVPAPQ